MNLRLHPLYKKFLLLSVVLGPMIWLLLTEDGRRRSDLVLGHLLGREAVNLAIEHLNGGLTEDEFRALFPSLALVCATRATPFGDRFCQADIGAFNAVPARALRLFLFGERLRALQVDYRRAYHATLIAQLHYRLGRRAAFDQTNLHALSWQVDDGLLLLPAGEPQTDSEAALIWLSTAALHQERRH